jgi:hypothetical protein
MKPTIEALIWRSPDKKCLMFLPCEPISTYKFGDLQITFALVTVPHYPILVIKNMPAKPSP